MTREEIFSMLQDCIVTVVPDVSRDLISLDSSLKQLGADSIDRSDIASVLKAKLGVDISPFDLGKPRDLGALVELLQGMI